VWTWNEVCVVNCIRYKENFSTEICLPTFLFVSADWVWLCDINHHISTRSMMCSFVATVACDDQFQCSNTKLCIPPSWICDGLDDCGDFSDEVNCSEWLFIWLTVQLITLPFAFSSGRMTSSVAYKPISFSDTTKLDRDWIHPWFVLYWIRLDGMHVPSFLINNHFSTVMLFLSNYDLLSFSSPVIP